MPWGTGRGGGGQCVYYCSCCLKTNHRLWLHVWGVGGGGGKGRRCVCCEACCLKTNHRLRLHVWWGAGVGGGVFTMGPVAWKPTTG